MSGARDIVHAPEALALKVATRALVSACGGGEGAAATIGARQQRMSDCGLPNTADFLRIDEVAALEDVTFGQPGSPHVTRALCRRAGGVFVPLPQLPMCAEAIEGAVAEFMGETGEMLQELRAILADRRIEAIEASTFCTQADDVIVAIERMKNLVRDQVPQSKVAG